MTPPIKVLSVNKPVKELTIKELVIKELLLRNQVNGLIALRGQLKLF